MSTLHLSAKLLLPSATVMRAYVPPLLPLARRPGLMTTTRGSPLVLVPAEPAEAQHTPAWCFPCAVLSWVWLRLDGLDSYSRRPPPLTITTPTFRRSRLEGPARLSGWCRHHVLGKWSQV